MKPRILVIRGGAIGDFVLTLPAIKLLRDNFPQVHLEILGYKHIIALAEGRYYADATRSIEYGGLSRFFIPGAELPEDLVEYFGSFQQVVSYLYDPGRIFRGEPAAERRPPFSGGKSEAGRRSATRCSSLRSRWKSWRFSWRKRRRQLFPRRAGPRRRSVAADGALSPARAGPLFALHPGSGSEKKNWPAERWAELGEVLVRRTAGRVLLIGGEADEAPRLVSGKSMAGPRGSAGRKSAAAGAGGAFHEGGAIPGPRQRHLAHRGGGGGEMPFAVRADGSGDLGAAFSRGDDPAGAGRGDGGLEIETVAGALRELTAPGRG